MKILLAAVFVTAIVAVPMSIMGEDGTDHNNKQDEEVIVVDTMTLRETVIPDEVTASGTVRAVLVSNISPKIMSTVSKVYVNEGTRVKKGDVLIKLEANDLSAGAAQARAAASAASAQAHKASAAVELQKVQSSTDLARAKAGLKAAKEQLKMAKTGPRKQQKLQADLAVKQAKAQFDNAKVEYGRMKRLYEQDVIPKQRLDQVSTQFEVAKAQYEIAKQQADMANEGSRDEEVRMAEENVRQAEEAVRLAKAAQVQNKMTAQDAKAARAQASQAHAAANMAGAMLSYATIRAPFDGVVTSRMVDPGDTVAPGMPIIVVEDDSLFRLEATVAASDVDGLALGDEVRLSLGDEELSGEGVISVISPAGDPMSRKFLVKADIPTHMRPKTGDYGKMSFAVGHSKGVVVSEDLISDEGGIENVFIISEDGRAVRRIVTTGRKVNGGVEVTAGLASGDKLIVKSIKPLHDDVKVKVREK